MKLGKPILAGLCALWVLAAPASTETLGKATLNSLFTMRAVYEAMYAPAEWKKTWADYDLDKEFNTALAETTDKSALNVAESREILKNFVYAMKDYHTSIEFTATEAATLPFLVKSAGDQFFLVDIDRSKLGNDVFPFNVGDELVNFGEHSTAEAVAEVQGSTIENVPVTDKALAEIALTNRRASRGVAVPQGPITLGIKRVGEDVVREVELIWEYTPEIIKPRDDLSRANIFKAVSKAKISTSLFRPQMSVSVDESSIASRHDIGARVTFTPELGEKVWESSNGNTFHAYIYKNVDGRKIGYVRIPMYVTADYVQAVADFAGIMALFEKETDALVIDQVNNPGGSVFYLYALASMLTDKPLTTPLHRMAIAQADVAEALSTIEGLKKITSDKMAKALISPDALDGYPVTYQFLQFYLSYARFLVDEWNAGRKLTRPYWIAGVNKINPGVTHYTKPILLLVNQLDFSGGDFFPAILQDNKRVTVMGSRTAGAGGYVFEVTVPNNTGISSFRCTGSLAERVDKNPIENLGVQPDIAYDMTAEDYQKNFEPYVKAVNAAVKGLIK